MFNKEETIEQKLKDYVVADGHVYLMVPFRGNAGYNRVPVTPKKEGEIFAQIGRLPDRNAAIDHMNKQFRVVGNRYVLVPHAG
jgi:hypothetical protein